MFNPSSTDDAIPFPSELNLLRAQSGPATTARRLHAVGSKLSGQVVPWKAGRTSAQSGTWRSSDSNASAFADIVDSYAAPLAPLWERDMQALGGFFEREDMPDIEADIIRNLLSRWPEPCWEDDPFDFLREFL